MNENELVYSGAIRFSDEYNIGVYITKVNDVIKIVIRDENTGEVIYPVSVPPIS